MTDQAQRDPLQLSDEQMQWWREARYGLFLHWGLYALLGRSEWAMFLERFDRRTYAKLADSFDARDFDPKQWARIAAEAGMKYMVLTTRHHDGFCLFDSRATDFKATNAAAKRDLVAEYVEACRAAGLGVGFYYSPLNWQHPGFFFPRMYRDSAEQMKAEVYAELEQLMTDYGKVDVLWYDGGGDEWLGLGGLEFTLPEQWHQRPKDRSYSGPPLWEPRKLNAMVRAHQPDIVISERSGWVGDFSSREMADGSFDPHRPWERCTNLTPGGWGWRPNAAMLSRTELTALLVRIMGMDGNLLLNVGPRPAGDIEPRQAERLAEVGRDVERYGEAIYGTRGGPFLPGPWGASTCRGQTVYLHIADHHLGPITLPGLREARVVEATDWSGRPVDVTSAGPWLTVDIGPDAGDATWSVVELELDQPVSALPIPYTIDRALGVAE